MDDFKALFKNPGGKKLQKVTVDEPENHFMANEKQRHGQPSAFETSNSTMETPSPPPRLRNITSQNQTQALSRPEHAHLRARIRSSQTIRRAMGRLGFKRFAAPTAPILTSHDVIASMPASVIVTRPRSIQLPTDNEVGNCDDPTLHPNDMAGGARSSNSPADLPGSGTSNAVVEAEESGSDSLRERDIPGLEAIIFGPRDMEPALRHASMASTMMLPNQKSDVSTTIKSAPSASLQSPTGESDSIAVKSTSGMSTQSHEDAAAESNMEVIQSIPHSSQLSVQDTAYDVSRNSDEDTPSAEGHEALKASHQKEIEQLKVEHGENLQILSNDLQQQKDKTLSANNRAGKANKELKELRTQQKELAKELAAAKFEAQQQQQHAEGWNTHQCNEILRLNGNLQAESQKVMQLEHDKRKVEARVAVCEKEMGKLEAEKARYKSEYQQLQQDVFHKDNSIENLQDQVTGLQHQMKLAIDEKSQALLKASNTEAQLEKQQLINKAIVRRRADDYGEKPQGELDGTFEPDQFRDVEQAFLTSQKARKETEAKCVALHNELVEERTAKEALERTVADLRDKLTRFAFLGSREGSLEKSIVEYLNTLVRSGEASEEAKEWTEKTLRASGRLRKAVDDVMEENDILRNDLSEARESQIAEAAKHSVELDDLRQEVHRAQTEVLDNALVMRDLKQANVHVRRLDRDVRVLQAEKDGLERKLALKVIKPIELELWNKQNTQIGELNLKVDVLEKTVRDQEMYIDQQAWALFEAKERYVRRFAQPMKVFYAQDRLLAIVNAVQERFGSELKAQRLIVDVTDAMIMLNEDERKEFLDFSVGIPTRTHPDLEAQHGVSTDSWLQVTYDTERLAIGFPAAGAAHRDTPAHEEMIAAVNKEAAKRRAKELEVMREQQVNAEHNLVEREEARRRAKEAHINQRYVELHNQRIEREAIDAGLNSVMPHLRQRKDWDSIDPDLYDKPDDEIGDNHSDYAEDYDDLPNPTDANVNGMPNVVPARGWPLPEPQVNQEPEIKQESEGVNWAQRTDAAVQAAAQAGYQPGGPRLGYANGGDNEEDQVKYQTNYQYPPGVNPYVPKPPAAIAYAADPFAQPEELTALPEVPRESTALPDPRQWQFQKPQIPAHAQAYVANGFQVPEDSDEDSEAGAGQEQEESLESEDGGAQVQESGDMYGDDEDAWEDVEDDDDEDEETGMDSFDYGTARGEIF
jgi:hypothetical protein